MKNKQMQQKLIIDTDPGIDDAMAIHYAFAHPGLDVLGLTTIFGNVFVPQATRNALLLSEQAHYFVDVAEGASRPLVQSLNPPSHHVHGAEGFGDVFAVKQGDWSLIRGDGQEPVLQHLEAIGHDALVVDGALRVPVRTEGKWFVAREDGSLTGRAYDSMGKLYHCQIPGAFLAGIRGPEGDTEQLINANGEPLSVPMAEIDEAFVSDGQVYVHGQASFGDSIGVLDARGNRMSVPIGMTADYEYLYPTYYLRGELHVGLVRNTVSGSESLVDVNGKSFSDGNEQIWRPARRLDSTGVVVGFAALARNGDAYRVITDQEVREVGLRVEPSAIQGACYADGRLYVSVKQVDGKEVLLDEEGRQMGSPVDTIVRAFSTGDRVYCAVKQESEAAVAVVDEGGSVVMEGLRRVRGVRVAEGQDFVLAVSPARNHVVIDVERGALLGADDERVESVLGVGGEVVFRGEQDGQQSFVRRDGAVLVGPVDEISTIEPLNGTLAAVVMRQGSVWERKIVDVAA